MEKFLKQIDNLFYKYIRGEVTFPVRISTCLYRNGFDFETLKTEAALLRKIQQEFPYLDFHIEKKNKRKINSQSICKFASFLDEESFLKVQNFKMRNEKLNFVKEYLGLDYSSATNSNINVIEEATENIELFSFIIKKILSGESKNYTYRSFPHSGDGKFIERNLSTIKVFLSLVRNKKKSEMSDVSSFFLKPDNCTFHLKASDDFVSFSSIPLNEIVLKPSQINEIILSENYDIYIIENKQTFQEFVPTSSHYIKIWGSGRQVVNLADLTGLADKVLFYYGDLDLDGIDILSSLRKRGLTVKSIGMGTSELEDNLSLATQNSVRSIEIDHIYLTDEEIQVVSILKEKSLKLEQEKIR
ncbi:MAG: hypothetical protein CME60_08715 [Halobacteriovoraceae bacterium]|nr:hypothetical protein [Halobacteriovoraceae bacterium]